MRITFGFAAAALALSAPVMGCSSEPQPERLGTGSARLEGRAEAFYVVLDGPPAVAELASGIDPRSPAAAAATRARVAEIEAQQAALRPELEREGARIVAQLSRLANAVQILADRDDVARIERLPGVVRVETVPLVEPTLASALPVIGAPAVWAKATPLQGDGITIGIIDSGIDYTHADFAGAGTAAAYLANDPKVIEPGSFPTTKVIGGWDFVGDEYNPDGPQPQPKPDPDPLDCTQPENPEIAGGHGTHVAGIAGGTGVAADGTSFAGPYEASFDPLTFRVAPGVAPRASLFALKIFGCDGPTTMVGPALERASDPNQDGVFDDRLDVVNMSLGTSYALGSPTQRDMVANLTMVGTLIVAAAGNSGQNFFSTSAPGSYPEILSVAASADNEFLTLSVTAPASAVAEYPSAEGGFAVRLVDYGALSSELVAANPAIGCSAFTNAAAVAGKVALIDRGSCAFVDKFQNAVAAGAIACVIVDNEDDPLPFAMGGGDPGSIPIPGVLVRQDDGVTIKAALAQGPLTIALDPAKKFEGAGAELLAGFSGRGPSPSDGRLKPEIAAPGFSIDSARVGSGTEPRRSQGTSMASPFVAGAAALVRQAQPGFSPLEVKAALVNSTEPLHGLTGNLWGTSVVGSGRLAVERAVEQRITAAADPATGEVGVSFGAIVTDQPTTVSRTVTVANHGPSAVSLGASVEPTFELPGLEVVVAPRMVDVAPGQTATLELTLTLDPAVLGSPGPDPGTNPLQGGMSPTPRHYLNEATGLVRMVHLRGSGEDVLVPFNGSVRAAVNRKAKAPACAPAAGAEPGAVSVELVGDGAHPEPVVTAFELGLVDEELTGAATNPEKALIDLRAVGVATDLATATSFGSASVYFGVAITGTWTTPARGPLSVVAIEIDSDEDPSADYAIRVEARNPDGPFRDALVASTYYLATGERLGRYPINMAAADVAKTNPFYNSVLAFSAFLNEIGVDPANPVFRYAATTSNPESLTKGERTGWVTFDASKPVLDTTKYAPEGVPLFKGAGPVLVDVSPDARASGAPLDLLLLHHTNVAGARFEVVSLIAPQPGNLAVTASAPPTVAASGTETITFVVTNTGVDTAPKVKLAGSLTGGELVSALATQGSCAAGATLDCALGDVPAGASVTVTAMVRAAVNSPSVAIEANVEGDIACDSNAEDNVAKATLAVAVTEPKAGPGKVEPGGGCGCRVVAPGRPSDAGWAIALALGLFARRRRRAKSHASLHGA